MAHEVEYNVQKQTHSFYSRKEIAWHKLGQVVEEAKTSDEVLELANLNFHVKKLPNYAYNEYADESYLNSNSFSTVRTDTKAVLGTVGTKYSVLQNQQAFNFFDDIVGGKLAIYETAGVLFNGQKVFVTAKLPNHIRFSNNDVVEQYLLLTNDHTGKESAIVTFTPVRVVCNNTLNMALNRSANQFRIRHTGSMYNKLKEVEQMLGLTNKYFEELKITSEAMKSKTFTEKDVKNHIMELVLSPSELSLVQHKGTLRSVTEISTMKKNTITDIYNWTENGVGQDMYRGTGLWLYNGVNGYYNNGKSYKDDEARMTNLIGGTASNIVNKSKNLIVYA